MATATPILDPPGGGSGGGFTPGATKRIPFGDASGTALTDSANFLFDDTNKRITGPGGLAIVQLENTNGACLYYANGCGVNFGSGTAHFFTGGLASAVDTWTFDDTKLAMAVGKDLTMGAVATNATAGFFRPSIGAGPPTGAAPEFSIYGDSTNHVAYIRLNGAWKSVNVT